MLHIGNEFSVFNVSIVYSVLGPRRFSSGVGLLMVA